ncbi:polysaccharide pyruvyl transferase family protein [Micromonospora sp. HUAS LYJ1]|uniref:polysaccharide pyruvyl transferase family protein n=1 Tax=Micromonospora sp. HUAS LYJ1 TaxID=3061626 RepID=UPI002672254B|nr:polysaccharide pyruvyl transferase family protein [Micromonospora sp. HUAS LYJ1]WKU05080.1 hypothetical protein Q2K16_30715 [Micromonospora sp. HUAS LYJ1]
MAGTIGLVCMGEAGNLGDDLIMVAAAQSIAAGRGDAEVRHLSFGRPVDWAGISSLLAQPLRPVPVRPGRDLPGSRRNELLFADCDAVVFGGGGLLQTSHHPHNPLLWLGMLPRAVPLVPVLGVGLGVGPLSADWERRLRRWGSPFDACWLRDGDSVAFSERRLGWAVGRCHDFVDRQFLDQFGVGGAPCPRAGRRVLGVALRWWPSLDARRLAEHIDRVATRHGVDMVHFFVLEATPGGPDVEFSQSVRHQLATPGTELTAYRGQDILAFLRGMVGCTAAVSMKLHSNAVWAALGIPLHPISYAPKTAAFFGRPYRGLEVIDEVVSPVGDDPAVPRAAEVVADWLRGGPPVEGDRRAALRLSHRLRLQAASTAINIGRRVGRQLRTQPSGAGAAAFRESAAVDGRAGG